MFEKGNPQSQPRLYEIRVRGHLGPEWTEWFGGMAISREENGDTLLSGSVADQAALHGLLKKVRDLGLPLLSVNCLKTAGAGAPTANENERNKRALLTNQSNLGGNS